jgi:hypothetical protein
MLLAALSSCSRTQDPQAVKQLPQGAEFAGFLSDYKQLKPDPDFENTLSYVDRDEAKNIHKYIAVIVEPVAIYVATNADPSKMPDRGRAALATYFQNAVIRTMNSAFPVVTEPGPLILRLRTALIGVDVGDPIASSNASPDALARAVVMGKVGVEMEMVDSVTGEQIAAVVDRQTLGAGAVIGSVSFSHDDRYAAASAALDGWAERLRDFLNQTEELSQQDQQRADASYHPFMEPAPR